MASLTLEQIRFGYQTEPGRVSVFESFSLDVSDGELMVLVGPSGSGKTTLLRLIAGLEVPQGGAIRIGDRIVNKLAPRDRDLAMVFQNYSLYPDKSVFDNMAFALRMRHVPASITEKSVREMAKKLGLTDLLNRKPSQLSGGEKQRVALGRAVVRSPSLFLFDEPLSNLDVALRSGARQLISAVLRSSGKTALYVTHDQEEAMILADRIAVIRDGRLLQCAAPTELYLRPANQFVASFFGTPSMNFIHGVLQSGPHACTFHADDFTINDLPAPAGHSSRDRRVVLLGIRPADIVVLAGQSPATKNNEARLAGSVSSMEFLGDSRNLWVDTRGGVSLAIRCPVDRSYAIGENIDFSIPVEKIHFFDTGGDGVRLNQPGSFDQIR